MRVILTLTAFLTATISGILGMGGGTLLLAMMFCFLPHGEAVPLHAAVQLVSNGSRIVVFWKDVDWPTVARFAVGLIPGVVLAVLILRSVGGPGRAEPHLKILIGVYILSLALLPGRKGDTGAGTRRGFALLGFGAGAAGVVVGAVGPLIAPLFARRNFVKEGLIATKAVCQVLTHLFKIPAFWMLGTIEFAEFSQLLMAMAIVAVLGTVLGKRLLRNVSAHLFLRLYKVALIVAGLKILVVDGLKELLDAV